MAHFKHVKLQNQIVDVNARWVAKVGIVGLVQVLMQTRLRGATCSGTDPEFGFQAGAGDSWRVRVQSP